MSAETQDCSIENDNYHRVMRLGFVALAWEFMRRSRAYFVSSTKARLGKLDAEAICREFGIEKIKRHDEWYFEGATPQFVTPRTYAYKHKQGGRGIRQTKAVELAPGQVAVVIDLKADVSEQFKIVSQVLRQLQRKLETKGSISPARERLPSTSDDLWQYCRMLRALDMNDEGKSAAEIGLVVARDAKNSKSSGRSLLRRATSMCEGGYRMLALYGFLGYDQRTKKPRKPRPQK